MRSPSAGDTSPPSTALRASVVRMTRAHVSSIDPWVGQIRVFAGEHSPKTIDVALAPAGRCQQIILNLAR